MGVTFSKGISPKVNFIVRLKFKPASSPQSNPFATMPQRLFQGNNLVEHWKYSYNYIYK